MAKTKSKKTNQVDDDDPFADIIEGRNAAKVDGGGRNAGKNRNHKAADDATQVTVEITRPGVWPTNVPILLETDFCRGRNDHDEQHDLMGWLEAVFDAAAICNTPCRNRAYNTLIQLVQERSSCACLAEYSDTASPADLAAVWHDMLGALGYEV